MPHHELLQFVVNKLHAMSHAAGWWLVCSHPELQQAWWLKAPQSPKESVPWHQQSDVCNLAQHAQPSLTLKCMVQQPPGAQMSSAHACALENVQPDNI